MECYAAVVDRVRAEVAPPRLFLGGHSMGGRTATMMAADGFACDGLLPLAYPLHPAGQPEKLRTAHLAPLRTPALVVQGTRDPFGTPEEVATYTLAPSIHVHWIADGDHSLVPRKASGRSKHDAWQEAVEAVAAFVGSLAR